jgi:protein involved in polysaccharide export with SLBB domain
VRAVRASFAPLADLSSASVIRAGQAEPVIVDLRELLARSVSPADMALRANDRIVIPLLRFSVFISGAVENAGTYPYAPGRTYHYYVTLAGGSTQDAPEKIFITDVNGRMRDQREAIQSEDRIFVIPADVMVQGAVFTPGSFSYREGLPASYYVNLAGGIDPERNGTRSVKVYDSLGKRRKADDPVKAGDRIYVPNNGFVYNFNRYAPILLTVVTIINLVLDSYDLLPP